MEEIILDQSKIPEILTKSFKNFPLTDDKHRVLVVFGDVLVYFNYTVKSNSKKLADWCKDGSDDYIKIVSEIVLDDITRVSQNGFAVDCSLQTREFLYNSFNEIAKDYIGTEYKF